MPKREKRGTLKVSNEPCAFCRITVHDAEAKIVFEDSVSMAFLDFRPLFPGHCLLIPKAHYSIFSDLPSDLIGPLFSNARRLATAVQDAMRAEGAFVAINNIVSQSVPHFHIHIVPRRRGDGLRGFFWPRQKYTSDEDLISVQQAIVSELRKQD
jgi:histidine triad (HIT) family protein